MRALRRGLEGGELPGLVLGSGLTFLAVLLSVHSGPKVGLGAFVFVAVFAGLVAAWVYAPHVVVAASIPLFASMHTAKVLVTPWLGPVKDLITFAGAVAILVTSLMWRRGVAARVDPLLIWLTVGFLGLYVVNLGGDLTGGHHGLAWAQGVRLVAEPLVLLMVGLTLRQPRKTLEYALVSLIVTGAAVAAYGILQQYLGGARLVGMGYSYTSEVRTIGGRLRSFGTLDDSFGYAAFLLLALVGVLFWMRRGPLKVALMSVMIVGISVSYVRSALIIAVALGAIWLLSAGRATLGLLLLGASTAAALAFLFAAAGANETHSVQTGPNEYLTLNGRTTVWKTVFAKPARVPFGLGVGKVGTAADRAKFGVVADPNKAQQQTFAVDSGYFATVADVGIVGLLLFAALLTRLGALGVAATRRPGPAGWLVIGWLVVMLLDAVTRASFTGFPTAFLGMLLVGVGLAASSARPVSDRR
jgi:hypothetical protein